MIEKENAVSCSQTKQQRKTTLHNFRLYVGKLIIRAQTLTEWVSWRLQCQTARADVTDPSKKDTNPTWNEPSLSASASMVFSGRKRAPTKGPHLIYCYLILQVINCVTNSIFIVFFPFSIFLIYISNILCRQSRYH